MSGTEKGLQLGTPIPNISIELADIRRSSESSNSSKDIFQLGSSNSGVRFQQHNVDSISQYKLPPPSPGFLSVSSAVSELETSVNVRRSSEAGISDISGISNVSSTLSEHLKNLVRAFSSRTERVKETTIQPPTPSSLSDFDNSDAFSAASAENTKVRHRFDSFFPPEEKEPDSVSEIVRIRGQSSRQRYGRRILRWLKNLKFPHTLEPQSKLYLFWLFLITLAFMYNAWAIPLRAVFPYQTKNNLVYWLIFDYTCDLLYIVDLFLFKMRISYLNQGVKEVHQANTRRNYMKKRMFKLDIACLLPLDVFYLINMEVYPWLRLPRLLKIQTFWEFYERCDKAVRSAHAVRILRTMTYMLFLIHLEACGYYAMSVYEGIGSNRWVYSGEGNAYIRCFYLATKTATSIGNNPKPTNIQEYMFMTVYWVSGVFVFALLIGQIRDIVDAANMVKNQYLKRMESALVYMKNMRLPQDTQERVRMWFIYQWQQQKVLDERALMNALPRKLRTDLAIHVHFNTLSKVKLFQDCDKTLLYDLVLKLKPILYLPRDIVCKKGEIGKEMYIVSQGQVDVVGGPNNDIVLATLKEGSVFGEISLLSLNTEGGNRRTADVRCKGFTNLFILSKLDFEAAMRDYPEAHSMLKKRAKKLLRVNARLAEQRKESRDICKVPPEEIIKTPPETPKLVQTVIKVMDPQSSVVQHLNMRTSSYNPQMTRTFHEIKEAKDNCQDNKGFDSGSEESLTPLGTNTDVEELFNEIMNSDDPKRRISSENVKEEHDDPNVHKTETMCMSNDSKESSDSGAYVTSSSTPSGNKYTITSKVKESIISVTLSDILEETKNLERLEVTRSMERLEKSINEETEKQERVTNQTHSDTQRLSQRDEDSHVERHIRAIDENNFSNYRKENVPEKCQNFRFGDNKAQMRDFHTETQNSHWTESRKNRLFSDSSNKALISDEIRENHNTSQTFLLHNKNTINYTLASFEDGASSTSNISDRRYSLTAVKDADTSLNRNVPHIESNGIWKTQRNPEKLDGIKQNVVQTSVISPMPETIPVDNKVTCLAEIHREKSLSPSSLSGQGNQFDLFTRRRKVSVISMQSNKSYESSV
ncbi:hypothetical protein CHS0354_010416 [Potamilus streckersoni]|uniref:Cyclic nucleotide-binding domain-containing protein n=1 Tax=Potamilus streckersoni TaxID=2493646 RepID=A0AAE0RQJ8_9BIVA|nr:hypothetical protein CHS0354_010416 [Potamilus streckersoni]